MKKIKLFFSDLMKKVKNLKDTLVDKYNQKCSPKVSKCLTVVKKYTGLAFLGKQYRRLNNKTKKAICGYLFIAPFIIGFIYFGIMPLYDSVRMAMAEEYFQKYNELTGVREFFIKGFGFYQFKAIFSQNKDNVVDAIVSVLFDVAIVVPLVLIFSLVLSLLLNKKIKGVKVFRMIFFIPVILLSGNLISSFNKYGLLVVPGISGGGLQETLEFYLPPQITEIIFQAFEKIVLILWLGGVQILIFLAGLQKTNKPVYEAAAIDGATTWEMFWKITFPTLIPLMIINIVYTTVVYASLGNELTAIINQCIGRYERAYASALCWILFMIELVVIGVYCLVLFLANKKYD